MTRWMMFIGAPHRGTAPELFQVAGAFDIDRGVGAIDDEKISSMLGVGRARAQAAQSPGFQSITSSIRAGRVRAGSSAMPLLSKRNRYGACDLVLQGGARDAFAVQPVPFQMLRGQVEDTRNLIH